MAMASANDHTHNEAAIQAIQSSRRLIIKTGSALLCDDAGAVRRDFVSSIAKDIHRLRADGRQVILVTSGAIAIGRRALGLGASITLEEKQAASAVGQSVLIDAWRSGFDDYDTQVAQILLTLDVTENRKRYLNARGTINALLDLGAIPVINENDSIATSEIRYGDNDRLAAHAAQIAGAQLLVILSDIDGLYNADPRREKDAQFIPVVEGISDEVKSFAGGENTEIEMGTGGMRSKLEAAEIAARSGCATLIASGRETQPIAAIEAGARATLIRAPISNEGARRRWIGGHLQCHGGVEIDDGAVKALRGGASLLSVGISNVFGEFTRGDVIFVRAKDGSNVGQGLCAFDVGEVKKIAGKPSDAIERELGYLRRPAIIEKDDLFLF